MTGQVLSIILDIAVLIGLGFTIFYCLKLSNSMNNFRQQRTDMNHLIEKLSKNIDEALRAIDGLKIAGDRSGRELQKIINESKAMADELNIINEAGNNLATRLESLADGNRFNATYAEGPDVIDEPVRRSAEGGFFIQDRDYNDEGFADNDDLPEAGQSQAEKELLEALRKNKKSPSRGAF